MPWGKCNRRFAEISRKTTCAEGLCTAYSWNQVGFSGTLNEAGDKPGLTGCPWGASAITAEF